MKTLINPTTKEVYVYESDGSQDAYIKPGLVLITDADLAVLRAPKLADVAKTKLASLQQSYSTARYADVTVAGKMFPGNRDYQFAILTMASRSNRGRPIPATIRGRDGVAVSLTPALLGQIEDALFDQEKNASDNLAAKTLAVNAATTVAQVGLVVW